MGDQNNFQSFQRINDKNQYYEADKLSLISWNTSFQNVQIKLLISRLFGHFKNIKMIHDSFQTISNFQK